MSTCLGCPAGKETHRSVDLPRRPSILPYLPTRRQTHMHSCYSFFLLRKFQQSRYVSIHSTNFLCWLGVTCSSIIHLLFTRLSSDCSRPCGRFMHSCWDAPTRCFHIAFADDSRISGVLPCRPASVGAGCVLGIELLWCLPYRAGICRLESSRVVLFLLCRVLARSSLHLSAPSTILYSTAWPDLATSVFLGGTGAEKLYSCFFLFIA